MEIEVTENEIGNALKGRRGKWLLMTGYKMRKFHFRPMSILRRGATLRRERPAWNIWDNLLQLWTIQKAH